MIRHNPYLRKERQRLRPPSPEIISERDPKEKVAFPLTNPNGFRRLAHQDIARYRAKLYAGEHQ
ncbi:hypothetical protein BFP70_06065 [Thioclava sp. SK-1]|nr:hypothetical protein BFP70_06065 [Thioclava sp. SK-1]